MEPEAKAQDDPALAGSSTHCETRTRAYRGGRLETQGFPAEQISDRLDQEDTFIWLDLLDPDHDDLQLITDELGLHPLAVDDAVNEHQRPKVDRYESHLFLNVYAIEIDKDELVTSEVSAFITERALVTVRKTSGFSARELQRRWDENADLAHCGVSFLVYGLLDLIVDGHFIAVQELDEAIEELEGHLFAARTRNDFMQRRSFQLRKSLVLLRRLVLPMREMVNTLIRRDLHIADHSMAPYYQDLYDHVLRVSEWTEGLRDMVTSVFETNLNLQSNQLNEVMKKLTAWAAVVAVPTAITGYYGQNVPYPGFGHYSGFITSMVLMAAIVGGLLVLFRVKKWI